MENNKKSFVARHPDFKGDGIAIWVDVTEQGQKYLRVKVLNWPALTAFKYEAPKPKAPDLEV